MRVHRCGRGGLGTAHLLRMGTQLPRAHPEQGGRPALPQERPEAPDQAQLDTPVKQSSALHSQRRAVAGASPIPGVGWYPASPQLGGGLGIEHLRRQARTHCCPAPTADALPHGGPSIALSHVCWVRNHSEKILGCPLATAGGGEEINAHGRT